LKDIFQLNETGLVDEITEFITFFLQGIHENPNVMDQEIVTLMDIYSTIVNHQRIDSILKIHFLCEITNDGKSITNFYPDQLIDFLIKMILETYEEKEEWTIEYLNYLNLIIKHSVDDLTSIPKIIDQLLILFKKKTLLTCSLNIYESIVSFLLLLKLQD
jgi:hypothetical protein